MRLKAIAVVALAAAKLGQPRFELAAVADLVDQARLRALLSPCRRPLQRPRRSCW